MKNKSMKKILIATTALLASIFTNPFEVNAAESTTYAYFEGLLDVDEYQLVVKRHDEDRNTLRGDEDEYRTEVTAALNMEGFKYRRRAGNPVYEAILDPHQNMMKKEEPYSRKHYLDGDYKISAWVEQKHTEASGKTGAVTKIQTVPNAPLYTNTKKRAKDVFTIQKERLDVIEDALIGMSREGKGLSMINGFNVILDKIKGLKGGYKDLNDFKKTVMALTWLMAKGNVGDFIIISPQGYEEADSDEVSENPDEGTENLDVDEVRVVDTNIKVIVTADDKSNKKSLRIQVGPDNKPEYKEDFKNLFYQVSTGFEFKYNNYTRDNPEGFMKVVYEDIKTGKKIELFANEGVDGLGKEHVEYIRLYDIVLDALLKDEQKQWGSASGSTAGNNSYLGKFLFAVLNDFTDSLGITPMEELIYNRTDRSVTDKANKNYRYGLYPADWDDLILLVQRPAMAISLAFLGFAILKVIFMLNVDAMNVDSRVNVKRDIMNIITAVGGIVVFNVAFIAIAGLNYILVGLIYDVLLNGDFEILDTFMGNATGLIQGTFGDILLGFVSIGVKAYINVMYIARSVTISFLLALYPIFMVSAAFSGLDKIKDFMMELVSNIFLQSFHALVFMFITIASSEYSDIFTNTVLMTLLIPMSGAYRELLLGKKSGTLQGAAMVGTQASQQVKSMVRTGVGMAAGAAGALAGGGLMFAADRKLAGKDMLKNIRNNTVGSGEGGSGEGVMSKVGDAMAGVDNSNKDSLSLSNIVKDENITTEDIQASMDNINSAKGMTNMANIAKAIKRRDMDSVYNLLKQNSNMNDAHNALGHAKLEKEKYNEELYNTRALEAQKMEESARELQKARDDNMPTINNDGSINYGSVDNRTTVGKEELKESGISDFKALEGVVDTFTATFDTKKDSMNVQVPPTLARAFEQTKAFHKWKSEAVDTSPKAQNEWIKNNGWALSCPPKETGEPGVYRVQFNFMEAQLSATGRE